MLAELRFSQLSAPRQAFIRACQLLNFGKIRALAIRDSEPVFDEHTEVLHDLKLDHDQPARPEHALADFALASEVRRFFAALDLFGNGTVEHVEVTAGIPRRVVIKGLPPKQN